MCRYPKLKRSCNPERQIIQFFALTGNLYFKFSFFGSAITYIFVICQPPFLVLSCLDLHLCQKQPATNSDPKQGQCFITRHYIDNGLLSRQVIRQVSRQVIRQVSRQVSRQVIRQVSRQVEARKNYILLNLCVLGQFQQNSCTKFKLNEVCKA